MRYMVLLGMVLGISGCGGGSGDKAAAGSISFKIAAPADLTSQGDSLYQALISSTDGASTYQDATVPRELSDEDDTDQSFRYTLDIDDKPPQDEFRVVFRYVMESSKTLTILAQAEKSLVWSGAMSVDFEEADFESNYDNDKDGLSNWVELSTGSNPNASDSDGDGMADNLDPFPTLAGEDPNALDPSESTTADDALDLSDGDRDGLGNTDDNCPDLANSDQTDTDGDRAGDACDADDDNDGLSDSEEFGFGSDGFQTDPLRSDSDGDGFPDGIDNCPLMANSTQSDADGDDTGDDCDCVSVASSSLPNPQDYRPGATDLPDLRLEDTNCDGLDGTHIGDVLPVYVDANASRGGSGTRAAAFNSLAQALAVASTENRDLYLAAGDYDTNGISFTSPIHLYGGFSSGFGGRAIDPNTTATVLYTDLGDSVLDINGVTNIVLQGLILEQRNLANDAFRGLHAVTADTLTLAALVIRLTSSTTATDFTGIACEDSENVLVSAVIVEPATTTNEASGIVFDATTAVVRNSVIDMGDSEGTSGMTIEDGSEVTVLHSTIDGGEHPSGHAAALLIDNASVSIESSMLMVGPSELSNAILCVGGTAPALSLDKGLFYLNDPSALYLDCADTFYSDVAALEANSEIAATGTVLVGGDQSSLLDEDLHLVAGSPAVNAGGSSNVLFPESDAGIAIDVDLEDRLDTRLDIGADEL